MPIQFILYKTGLSKGGFYHHFKSREEILENLTRLRIDKGILIIDSVVSKDELSAIDQMNQILEALLSFRRMNVQEAVKILQNYLKDENLHKELQDTVNMR